MAKVVLIWISISLATALTDSETATTDHKVTDVTTPDKDITTVPAETQAANTQNQTKTTTSTRQSKVLRIATAGTPRENRDKRTLYDFDNPSYLYPEIASRRAGYITDTHSGYYPETGFYNGQNAIAQYPSDFGGHYAHYPQYLEAPEPIIEIIIKDSNETLPTLAAPQPITTKKKKEKVHVFYVNYKKDENNKLHLESPIASLNNDDEPQTDNEEEQELLPYPQVVTPLPPLKPTTLRTIIHPDSEKYHSNSGIHVSFGSEDKSQTGHILEEHDAESIQRPVVALPIDGNGAETPKSLIESYYANTRSDYAQGRSPASGNSLHTAPFQQPKQNNYYQMQQQQLPVQYAANYFRPPTPPTILGNQHQQNFYQQKSQQQQRPTFSAGPVQPVQQQRPLPQAQPLYRKPPTPTQQQTKQQQQQSHYYVNYNQQYLQRQPQPSFSPNQYFHQQTTSHKPTKITFFPTTSPKQQELPSRQTPPPYKPIKFRPTPISTPQIKPVPVPIPAKLENSHYQTAYRQEQQQQKQQQQQQQNYYQQQQQQQEQQQHKQQQFSFNRQQQQFVQSTSDFASPLTGHQQSNFYKPQPQQPPISSQNTVSQTKFQLLPNTQSHANSTQSVFGSLQNFYNVQPSKGTELFKSIPKFEQHITETIHYEPVQQYDVNYNQHSHEQQNEVIHNIPAPNLGPTVRPNVQQVQRQLPVSAAVGGDITQQQSNSQMQYTNFVTTSQSIVDTAQQQYPSLNAEPQYAQSQNIYNSQPLQAANNFVQEPRSPATSAVHSTIQTAPGSSSSSQYSVSTYHSDVFRELEQRKQTLQSQQQQRKIGPSLGAYIPTPTKTVSAPTTAATPTTTVAPTNGKASQTLLQLPDEVPDDLRQQLLTSGILNNADISVLDYDKVGDVALENLPAEHLQHFYGAGGGAQISESNKVVKVVKPNGDSVAQ